MYKIWRSSASVFGDAICPDGQSDETLTAIRSYTADELKKIAEAGFNAIWVHGILRHLVCVDPFPEIYQHSKLQLEAMKELTKRAADYDIKIFVYMQPPRALPQSDTVFWNEHPEIWGEEDIRGGVPVRSLCFSAPEVRKWLENAAAALAEALPDLGGIILITASELPQHCYSRRNRRNPTEWFPLITCPRCRKREPEDIVVDLITQVRNGIRNVSQTIEIAAWNWSWSFWSGSSEQHIIERLPKDVIIMADFERGGYKDLLRRPHFYMDEYSLGYAGPSEKYMSVFNTAKYCGLRFMSKLQLGTTHELANIVSLPLLSSIYDKAVFQKDESICGFMGCWNFGNFLPNSNVAAFNYFLEENCPGEKNAALRSFAAQYFPQKNADLLIAAWEQFQNAMYYYPFTIAFLYNGAHTYTLAFKTMYKTEKLNGEPAGRSWKFDKRGDDLSASYTLHHTQFNLDEIIERLGKLAAVWQSGTDLFKRAFEGCKDKRSLDELGNALICGAIWKSTENTYRIFRLRQDWNNSCKDEFFRIVDDELKVLAEVLPWIKRDPRQGFHIEPHDYMFNAESVTDKIDTLKKLVKSKLALKV